MPLYLKPTPFVHYPGLVGCEVAMHLAEMGKKVTMLDIVPNSSPSQLYGVDWVINGKLMEDHVDLKLGHKILSVTDKTVTCHVKKEQMSYNPKDVWTPADLSGPYADDQITYTADAVICALGMKSVNNLISELQAADLDIDIIGDAYKPRKILTAIHEGYHAGRRA